MRHLLAAIGLTLLIGCAGYDTAPGAECVGECTREPYNDVCEVGLALMTCPCPQEWTGPCTEVDEFRACCLALM